MNQNQGKSTFDKMDMIDRIRIATLMKSPGGASPCPHRCPGVTCTVTRRESKESMSAEGLDKKEPW